MLGQEREVFNNVQQSNAARRRSTRATSPLVLRPRVPTGLSVSSMADIVCQPKVENKPTAGFA